jgi:hypothetical protein
MTKHTPGPWRLETHSRSANGSDLIVTDGAGAYTVAGCCYLDTGVKSAEEAAANARLIAAAPDLLDQLKGMAAQHRCGCGHPACKRCADDRENDRVIALAE